MDVSLIFRVAGTGLLVAMCERMLAKSGREEQATLVVLAGLVVVFCMLIPEMGQLFDTLRSTFGL